jgi:uroporphyrinogen decarboxylase
MLHNFMMAARLLKRHFGNTVFLRGNCDQAPFSLTCLVRSTEGWLLDLTEPELKEPWQLLLDYGARVGVQFIQEMTD